jgi:hypothetical protein
MRIGLGCVHIRRGSKHEFEIFVYQLLKTKKQWSFKLQWSRGGTDFFFGLGNHILVNYILHREPTGNVNYSRHPRHDTFWSNTSPTTYKKCESGVSIIHTFIVFQFIALKKVDITCHYHPSFMLYSRLQIHDLNTRNMYKDDKYCHRFTAWNDFVLHIYRGVDQLHGLNRFPESNAATQSASKSMLHKFFVFLVQW